MLGRRHPAPA